MAEGIKYICRMCGYERYALQEGRSFVENYHTNDDMSEVFEGLTCFVCLPPPIAEYFNREMRGEAHPEGIRRERSLRKRPEAQGDPELDHPDCDCEDWCQHANG